MNVVVKILVILKRQNPHTISGTSAIVAKTNQMKHLKDVKNQRRLERKVGHNLLVKKMP
jgi:hypothetical protein